MSGSGIGQIVFYAVVLVVLAYPLGRYMAWVYSEGFRVPRWLGLPERGFYRLVGTAPGRGQDWKAYAKTVLVFMGAFAVLLYLILRLQSGLPLNPDDLPGVLPHIAMNTTASFISNTNW